MLPIVANNYEVLLIKQNGFPSDKRIFTVMKKEEIENLETHSYSKEYIKQFKVPPYEVPEIFRKSFLNNNFVIRDFFYQDKEADDEFDPEKYLDRLCCYFRKDSDYFENLEHIKEDRKKEDPYTKNELIFFQSGFYCDRCDEQDYRSRYACVDHILGFSRCEFDLCVSCYHTLQNYKDILKEYIPDSLLTDLISEYFEEHKYIIHNFKLVEGNEYELTINSYAYDWICFMSIPQKFIHWLINCNPLSKSYGCVFFYRRSRGRNQMLCEIKDFIDNFSYYTVEKVPCI
jgi:hypothetical protein